MDLPNTRTVAGLLLMNTTSFIFAVYTDSFPDLAYTEHSLVTWSVGFPCHYVGVMFLGIYVIT